MGAVNGSQGAAAWHGSCVMGSHGQPGLARALGGVQFLWSHTEGIVDRQCTGIPAHLMRYTATPRLCSCSISALAPCMYEVWKQWPAAAMDGGLV